MDLKSESYYTDLVQNYLHALFQSDSKVSEKCIIAVEAYVNINLKRLFRIIALVRNGTSHAVVIFGGKKSFNSREIRVLDVLPLNLELKLDSDKTRSANCDCHAAVLSGEDCTIVDFDPLSCPSHLVNVDIKDFSRKKIYLEFSEENFHNFSIRLSNASQFSTKDELFSSFNWLKKLKDETNSRMWIESLDSESDCDVSQTECENNCTNIFLEPEPVTSDLTTHDNISMTKSLFVSYQSPVNSSPIVHNVPTRYSKRDIHKSSNRLQVKQKSSDHHQSTPDLINGPFNDDAEYPSMPINDNRQFVYIEKKLRQKENEYCVWENHTLFVGTWNVNGRIDDLMSLDDWLTPPTNVNYPNFYVIGFQELDLSIGSVALNRSNMSYLEERWLKLIENSMPFRKNHYKRLYRVRMAGILMVVYIDRKLAKSVPDSQLSASKVPTGILNVMGNKGAVGIRFRVYNCDMCFINCHLAAGESNRMRRDQDFREIEKNLIFYDENDKVISVYEHDLVILMGDLNYRILNIDAEVARDLANMKVIDVLLENDELINESKAVFKRFYEGKITFMPTYKFDPNSNNYDTSEKNRVPSFCDRVMWTGDHCQLVDYSSHMSLISSDHKPVSAIFTVGLKKIDMAKRMKVQETIIRGMDLVYNLSLPQAKIDRQEINFENIHFYEYRQASISIINTGQYEFMFNFKEIPGCPKIPDWLTVQPSEGTVKTDETCELVFEIFINANNVSKLNTKPDLQCILILTLLGGKDYFITVTADFVPTCFGLPLSLLVSLKNPIATLTRKELYEKCKEHTENVLTTNSNTFSIPKEMFVMVDYLLKNITEEELFARPGFHSEIQLIREQLDTMGMEADFSTVCVHSVAEALLMFLSALYLPIVPTELIQDCMLAKGDAKESTKVILKLPHYHRNLFHYLMSFLRKVLVYQSSNGTDSRSLGILFLDLIFRPKNLDSAEREMCSQFIEQFLGNDSFKNVNCNLSLL